MAKPLPKDIRQARAFLYQRGITANQITPSRFAAAAVAMQMSFADLLKRIARMYLGEQGQGPFPETAKVLSK